MRQDKRGASMRCVYYICIAPALDQCMFIGIILIYIAESLSNRPPILFPSLPPSPVQSI